jgi:hypothetical protein
MGTIQLKEKEIATMMNIYTADIWEILGDMIEEVEAWEDFEADLEELDPWEDEWEPDLEMGFDPYAGCYDFDC